MQIQQIIYFHKIAEEKSMNKAAESLFITQSNLSYAIKKLEEEVGTKLLVRSNKGVGLTEDGRKFLEYSSVIMNQLDLIQRMSSQEKENNLSISSYPMMTNAYFLRKYYDEIQSQEWEDFQITFKEERMDDIIRNVSTSQSELGIIHYNQRQEKEVKRLLKQTQLEFNEMAKTTWYVAMGNQNPYKNQKCINIRELFAYPMIRAKDDYFSNLTSYLEVDGASLSGFKKRLLINDGATKINMLRETDAVSFIPGWTKRDYEKLGISVVEIENCHIEITIGWIKKKQENLSSNGQRYLHIVMNYFDN